MNRDALADSRAQGGFVAGQSQRAGAHVPVLSPGWKQVILRADGAPVASQYLYKTRRQHGIAVFFPLPLLDPQQLALGLDVGHLEGYSLGDPQAGAVARHQCGTILEAGDVVEKPDDFFLTEHDR